MNEENRETHIEPFPLKRPEKVIIRGFRSVSGKKPIVCENMALLHDTEIIVED